MGEAGQIIVERRKIAARAVTYRLPMPPSTNNLFANIANARVRTHQYKVWATEAGWAIKEQGHRTIHGPVKITIQLEDKHPRRDASNAIKAVEDLLTPGKHGLGIIDGDSAKFVRKVSAEWADVQGAVVTVEGAS